MMPLPLAPALMGALGALVTKAFDFFYRFFAYKLARNLAVASGAVAIAAALTLAMAQGVKVALLGIRMAMPGPLAQVTYFLPSNINQVIAVIVTVKLGHFIWQWSMKNLARYTMQIHV